MLSKLLNILKNSVVDHFEPNDLLLLVVEVNTCLEKYLFFFVETLQKVSDFT
jgi:hypothetical protein